MKQARTVVVMLLVVFGMAHLAEARGKAAPTAPGKYKEWGQDIDEIEVVKSFKTSDYDHIVVQNFDTSKVPLPDQKEKWYGTLKMALAGYTDAFTEAFKKELKGKMSVEESESMPHSAHTLVLRGWVEQLDPFVKVNAIRGAFDPYDAVRLE